jgi:hypothetical protein
VGHKRSDVARSLDRYSFWSNAPACELKRSEKEVRLRGADPGHILERLKVRLATPLKEREDARCYGPHGNTAAPSAEHYSQQLLIRKSSGPGQG